MTACRLIFAVVGLGLIGAPAAASEFRYKDWRFNTDAVTGELSEELVRSLQRQIDIVESLTIKPEIKAFFQRVDVRVDPNTMGFQAFYRARNGRISFHRIHLGTQADPPNRPVLLRMLLLAYLEERMPQGWHNAQIARYLDDAKRTGAFTRQTQMMHSPEDFFAFGVGAVLWGGTAVGQSVRANIRDKLPDFYGWIIKEFYPPGAP